ncbi:MAG: hypothetical protein Q9187_003224 [Circinaria calcarea]
MERNGSPSEPCASARVPNKHFLEPPNTPFPAPWLDMMLYTLASIAYCHTLALQNNFSDHGGRGPPVCYGGSTFRMGNFPVSEEVAALSNLNDGQKIWEVLLKQISKTLNSYVTGECGQTISQGPGAGDLKLIAMNGNHAETVKACLQDRDATQLDANDTIQLLKLVLIAALNSAKSEVYIQKMPSLSISTQAALKNLIEDVLALTHLEKNAETDIWQLQYKSYPTSDVETSRSEDVAPSPKPTLDPELLFEERFGKVMADNENLIREKKDMQKDLRDLHDRLVRLQENNAALQERLTVAEDRSQLEKSTRGSEGGSSVKELESRIQHQEDLIANQEGQLSDYQIHSEAMQKTIDNLRRSQEKSQMLRDEIDELRIERDSLAKTANAVKKYKQKLQASSNLEKENQTMRDELEDLRQQLKNAEQTRQQVAGLQLAVDEYKRILPKIEQDRHELQMMKKQLEFDNVALAQRWEVANEQHAKDQETIADLQDRAQIVASPNSPYLGTKGRLETELEDGRRHEDQMQVAYIPLLWMRLTLLTRTLDLKNQNQQLVKVSGEANAKCIMLQQMADDFKRRYADLEKKYSNVYQNNLDLESCLVAVRKGHPIESTEVFQKMRDQVKHEQQMRADCEAKLNNFKRQFEKDTGKPVLQSSSAHSDIQSALSMIQAAMTGGEETEGFQASVLLEKHISDLVATATESGERLIKQAEHATRQESEIHDLRDQLHRAETGGNAEVPAGDVSDQTALHQELELIKRENRLMATAYYDLASRLQMSNVSLQRRSETNRSFLNRHRQEVNRATSVRSR